MANRASRSQKEWVPPDAATRSAAVGKTLPEHAGLRAAVAGLVAGALVAPLRKPRASDWLMANPCGVLDQKGETFDQYCRGERDGLPPLPSHKRCVVYLCAVGEAANDGQQLEQLRRAVGAFFALPCKLAPPLDVSTRRIKSRRHDGERQLLTSSIYPHLKKAKRAHADAFCVMGITTTDLYPAPSWNFVFGEANPTDGVGIFSFARYGKAWASKRFWQRSVGTLFHEIGHLFGLQHCVFYQCVMNGSDSLAESDRHPLHVCPVCLRKLHYALQHGARRTFEPTERYAELAPALAAVGLTAEAAWATTAAERCSATSLVSSDSSDDGSEIGSDESGSDDEAPLAARLAKKRKRDQKETEQEQ